MGDDQRPLAHAAQCCSVVYNYLFSYGLVSQFAKFPVLHGYGFVTDMYKAKYPLVRIKTWAWMFSKAVPLAIMFQSMAHLTSHRYFTHHAYKTSRPFQCVLALIGACSGQRGSLWWSAIHTRHHRECGEDHDPHGARAMISQGAYRVVAHMYAQVGWLLDRQNFTIEFGNIPQWRHYPELLILEIFSGILFQLFLLSLFKVVGIGMQVVFVGFTLSFVFVGLENSVCHMGKWTKHSCDSLDFVIIGILTGGEGFHNGHHRAPHCACMAWQWGMLRYLDITYCVICILEKLGLIWNVRHDPAGMQLEKSAEPSISTATPAAEPARADSANHHHAD
jgi:stearoyl-CoA desaturase (delta-9 desaturase)